MPVPTHTYGQSTVTAVQLVTTYPSDSLYPSDVTYPDTTWAAVGPLGAVLAPVVNRATLAAPVVNDAHLTATSFGGAALTPAIAQIQLT